MSKKKRFPNLASSLSKNRREDKSAPPEQQSEQQSWWRRVQHLINEILVFLSKDIWRLDLARLTRPKAFLVHQVKVLLFLIQQFSEDKLFTRAAALTYSTLLAIVPLLAVIFSLFKGFGLHADLEPALSDLLSPLGARRDTIVSKIMEFVENSQTGALGVIGFATLLFMVFAILNNIEGSYNDIWHVRRARPYLRRFMDYTLLIVIGPLAIFLILGITGFVSSIDFIQAVITYKVFSPVVKLGLLLLPYALSFLFFTLAIWFIPNTNVKFKSAIIGGFFSGILWELSNWGFAQFVVGASKASTRDILFAGFAALPLFIFWINIGWSIVLLGSEFGYVVQHLDVMEWNELEKLHGDTLRRFVSVRAVLQIVQHSMMGREVPTLDELSQEIQVPKPILCDILESLMRKNILVRAEDGPERYLLAHDPDTVMVVELLLTFRDQTKLPKKLYAKDSFGKYVEQLLRQIDQSLQEEGVGRLSLSEAALSVEKYD